MKHLLIIPFTKIVRNWNNPKNELYPYARHIVTAIHARTVKKTKYLLQMKATTSVGECGVCR